MHRKNPFKVLIGIGGGKRSYLKKDLNNFVGDVGSLTLDVAGKYSIFTFGFRNVISPFTDFGVMYDGYVDVGLFFRITKKINFYLYGGLNFLGGKSSRDKTVYIDYYFSYQNGVYILQTNVPNKITYSSYMYGLSGVMLCYRMRNNFYLALNADYSAHWFKAELYIWQHAEYPYYSKAIFVGLTILKELEIKKNNYKHKI